MPLVSASRPPDLAVALLNKAVIHSNSDDLSPYHYIILIPVGIFTVSVGLSILLPIWDEPLAKSHLSS